VQSARQNGSLKVLKVRQIAELLENKNGHLRKITEAPGISEGTLYRKLEKYQLIPDKGPTPPISRSKQLYCTHSREHGRLSGCKKRPTRQPCLQPEL
jgi:hypothetical protein